MEYLEAIGWSNVGKGASVSTGSVVITHGSTGSYGHVVIGVGSDLIDAHNMARHHEHKSFYDVTTILHHKSLNSNATAF